MKFASAIVCAVGLLAATQAAAVPEIVTYAARVENDAGPFTGTASVTFQLFTDPVAGTEVFVETVASLVIVGGDLIHDLGSTTALDDVLDENDALFLQVTLNGETLEPRTPIRSVPWAIRASEADIAQSAVSATDAARLGGQLPSAFQFGVAANGGLAVANNQFSIANDAITSARIAAGAIETADIAANAVTSGLIADGAVGTADIANGAINAAKLVASAVGLAQLAANSVDATKIVDGSIGTNDFANSSVTSSKIQDGAVTQADLSVNSVGTNQIIGSEVDLFIRPIGCGGGLEASTRRTSGARGPDCVGGAGSGTNFTCSSAFPCACGLTCSTGVCSVIQPGLPRFFNCGGTCNQSAPKLCEVGEVNAWPSTSAVGKMLAP